MHLKLKRIHYSELRGRYIEGMEFQRYSYVWRVGRVCRCVASNALPFVILNLSSFICSESFVCRVCCICRVCYVCYLVFFYVFSFVILNVSGFVTNFVACYPLLPRIPITRLYGFILTISQPIDDG